jgi:hypothetical protein
MGEYPYAERDIVLDPGRSVSHSVLYSQKQADESRMVAIAVLALSVFHPAIYFPILSKPKRSAKTQTTTSKRRSLFRQEKTTETEEK